MIALKRWKDLPILDKEGRNYRFRMALSTMIKHSKRNGSRQTGRVRACTRSARSSFDTDPERHGVVRPEFVLYGKRCAEREGYPSAQILHTIAERMLANLDSRGHL